MNNINSQFAKVFNYPDGQLLLTLEYSMPPVRTISEKVYLVITTERDENIAKIRREYADIYRAKDDFLKFNSLDAEVAYKSWQDSLQKAGTDIKLDVGPSIAKPEIGRTYKLGECNIPWQDAKALAENHGQDMIVVLTYSSLTGQEHVLTWGKTLEQSTAAAESGNKLKLSIGWPEDAADAVSERVTAVHEEAFSKSEKMECSVLQMFWLAMECDWTKGELNAEVVDVLGDMSLPQLHKVLGLDPVMSDAKQGLEFPDADQLAAILLQHKKFGFLAQVGRQMCRNFVFKEEDGSVLHYDLSHASKVIFYVYAESAEELLSKIEIESSKLFEQWAARAREGQGA